MIFVIVGDIDVNEVASYLTESFKDFKRRARAPVVLPVEPAQLTSRFSRETGAYQVTRLHWAYHTVSIDHPDAPALDILASILGDGNSSILNRKIREEMQIVHSIGAWSHTPADGGMFGISATFDPDKENDVIQAIRDTLAELVKKPFSDQQITKAKRSYFISELGSLQTMSGQASSYGAGEYYAGNPRFSETYLEDIQRVDNERLHEVLKKYITDGHETVAILSPENTPVASNTNISDTFTYPMTRLMLSNGIPLIVREDKRLPFIYISAALQGGLLTETELKNGITQLTADLLTRGTKKRSAEEIADTIENQGASLSGFAGRNSFGINASGLSEDREMLMEMLTDSLLHPSFPDKELTKQKNQQIASIRQQQEQPMYLAQENLRMMLFPGHPYRLNMAGTESSVLALTRTDLMDNYTKRITADNIALSIFGDIRPEEARALADKYFGSISGRKEPSSIRESANPVLPSLIKTNGPFEQAILLVGYPGVDIRDERNDALNVLQRALSGLSSELAIEVREKRGLVYYIGATSMSGLDPGLFAFYAGTTSDKIDEVRNLIMEQIARIVSDGIRADEFERARAQLIASHDMSLQNTGELAQVCALNELYGLGYDYSLSTPERLQKLTLDNVIAAAASLFDKDKSATSIILSTNYTGSTTTTSP
jgi:zinc protease